MVDHELLTERESPGLGDEEVSLLHIDDRHEEGCLSVFQGVRRVADLRLSQLLLPVETWVLAVAVPSALGPCSNWLPEVEEPDVKINLSVRIPVKNVKFFVVEIRAALRVHEINTLFLRGLSWPELAKTSLCSGIALEDGIAGIVNIPRIGNNSWLSSKAEKSGWGNTVIVEHVEVTPIACKKLQHSNLEIRVANKLCIDQSVSFCASGVFLHDVELGVLVGERNGGNHISAEVDAKNENR